MERNPTIHPYTEYVRHILPTYVHHHMDSMLKDADIPYIEGFKPIVLAGLLTTFRLQVPSRIPPVASLLEGHKETHSCETVGESHSIPLFIANSEPRTFAKVHSFFDKCLYFHKKVVRMNVFFALFCRFYTFFAFLFQIICTKSKKRVILPTSISINIIVQQQKLYAYCKTLLKLKLLRNGQSHYNDRRRVGIGLY